VTGSVVSRRSIAASDPSGRVNPPESVALPGPLVGPAPGSNTVYLLTDVPNGSELFAVDVTTGAVTWHALPGGVVRGIAVTRDAILAPTDVVGAQPTTSHVVAYDPATGAVRWSSTPVPEVLDRPAVAGTLLFTGPQVLDVGTGASIPVSTSWCCEPVPAEGHLFVSTQATLQALVPSG
jgi:outer membrane protein assembly factor BamB